MFSGRGFSFAFVVNVRSITLVSVVLFILTRIPFELHAKVRVCLEDVVY